MHEFIGLIMISALILIAFLANLVPKIYWFIKCLTEGGDWKYYGENILCIVWVVALATAICLAFF